MAVNTLVLLTLLFVVFWDSNPRSPGRRALEWAFQPLLYIGLWHGWSMFAPDPIHIIQRLKAVIVLDDGSVEEWSPDSSRPETRLVNLLYARSFKYEHSLCTQRFPQLLLALCRYLCRDIESAQPGVLTIDLHVTSKRILPYGSETIFSDESGRPVYRYSSKTDSGQMIRQPADPKKKA